jgi:hypothetical protein
MKLSEDDERRVVIGSDEADDSNRFEVVVSNRRVLMSGIRSLMHDTTSEMDEAVGTLRERVLGTPRPGKDVRSMLTVLASMVGTFDQQASQSMSVCSMSVYFLQTTRNI